MNRFIPIRPKKHAILAMVLAVAAVPLLLESLASASSTKGSVRAAATITVPAGTEGGPGTALFTIGHARVQGECGLDPEGSGGTAKIQFVAVGGSIAVAASFWDAPNTGEVLTDGQQDAYAVNRSPGDTSPMIATTFQFAIFDADGPSFSGTAAVWMESNSGPCMFTAQVAG